MSSIKLIVIEASAETSSLVYACRMATPEDRWNALADIGGQELAIANVRDRLAQEVPEGTEIQVEVRTETLELGNDHV